MCGWMLETCEGQVCPSQVLDPRFMKDSNLNFQVLDPGFMKDSIFNFQVLDPGFMKDSILNLRRSNP
jgi:hypothetical protein